MSVDIYYKLVVVYEPALIYGPAKAFGDFDAPRHMDPWLARI